MAPIDNLQDYLYYLARSKYLGYDALGAIYRSQQESDELWHMKAKSNRRQRRIKTGLAFLAIVLESALYLTYPVYFHVSILLAVIFAIDPVETSIESWRLFHHYIMNPMAMIIFGQKLWDTQRHD